MELLDQAVAQRGEQFDEEYADKIIRSQLKEVAETTEALAELVGEGEAISVTEISFEED